MHRKHTCVAIEMSSARYFRAINFERSDWRPHNRKLELLSTRPTSHHNPRQVWYLILAVGKTIEKLMSSGFQLDP